MFKIGLTGGIGSGKSTVCLQFQTLGINIIDADIIAKQLVQPGLPTLTRLVDKFGAKILLADGNLDRNYLKNLVFSNSDKKKQLEDIMHPIIYSQIVVEIENASSPYCIVAVPLLLETQKAALVDRILVVDCNIEAQIKRVKQRDQLSREQILSIIASQHTREQRLALADDIIDNNTTQAQLAEQVKTLHNSYISLASFRIKPA